MSFGKYSKKFYNQKWYFFVLYLMTWLWKKDKRWREWWTIQEVVYCLSCKKKKEDMPQFQPGCRHEVTPRLSYWGVILLVTCWATKTLLTASRVRVSCKVSQIEPGVGLPAYSLNDVRAIFQEKARLVATMQGQGIYCICRWVQNQRHEGWKSFVRTSCKLVHQKLKKHRYWEAEGWREHSEWT